MASETSTTAEKSFELLMVKTLVLQWIAGYIRCPYRLVNPA
jgi:hypothetical protein